MAFVVPNQAQIASQRPVANLTPWVRPSDWIAITDAPNEVQFLVSSLGGGSYGIITTFTKPTTQNLYIDWGDGVTDTISTAGSVTTYHQYTTGGTACSLGYDTWKVRVYTDAGATITNCRPTYGQRFGTLAYPTIANGLLEAYFGDGVNITLWNQFFKGIPLVSLGNANTQFFNLQYVKMPATLTGSVNMTETFSACYKLAKVILPTSCTGLTTTTVMFGNCYQLQSVSPLPSNATSLTDISSMFANCVSLTGYTFPSSLPAVTTAASLFSGCYSLGFVQLPSLPACTNYTSTFANCHSLLSMNITGFTSTAQALTLTNMFQNCYSIEQILLPSTLASGSESVNSVLTTMFTTCYNLKTITLPTNLNSAGLSSTFLNCYSLVSATLPTNMSSLTTMASCFSNCINLQSVTLPTTVGATISLSSTFSSCNSIGTITIPSGWTITDLSSAFSNCWQLTTLTLPNNAQNSITSMNNMCNACYTLTGITMPTSLNACTDLSTAFQTTYNLGSVTFPSSMNACTNMTSTFLTSGIKSVTLPTSMTSLTLLNACFQAATNLETLVLPATVNSGCNVSSVAYVATNLKSITFPTSRYGVGVVNMNTIISNDATLQTINNLELMGDSATTANNYSNLTNFYPYGSSFTGTTDLYGKFSKLDIYGNSTTQRHSVTAIRLRNTATGQWGGASPQINISYTSLSTAALVQLFNDMAAQGTVTSKTINITGASGAAGLTASDRLIITSKGWTITG